EDLLTPLTTLLPVPHHIEGEDRTQLFNRERVVAADAVELCEEHAGTWRHGNATLFRDDRGGFSYQCGVWETLWRDEHTGDGFGFGFRHEIAAEAFEFALDVPGNTLVDHHGVLGRAQNAVVERLSGDDVSDRLFEVGGALDVCRGVARA